MTTFRRPALLGALALALSSGLAVSHAATASAVQFQLHSDADVTTYVKKMNQTIPFPRGSSDITVDSDTRTFTANLAMPTAKTTIRGALLGLTWANIEMKSIPVKPTTGTIAVTGTRWDLRATQTFDIQIVAVKGAANLVNYVPSTCKTATPITAHLTGSLDFGTTGPGSYTDYHLTGPYTIPKFANCGILTPALNLMVPGAGNTLDAHFTSAPIG